MRQSNIKIKGSREAMQMLKVMQDFGHQPLQHYYYSRYSRYYYYYYYYRYSRYYYYYYNSCNENDTDTGNNSQNNAKIATTIIVIGSDVSHSVRQRFRVFYKGTRRVQGFGYTVPCIYVEPKDMYFGLAVTVQEPLSPLQSNCLLYGYEGPQG